LRLRPYSTILESNETNDPSKQLGTFYINQVLRAEHLVFFIHTAAIWSYRGRHGQFSRTNHPMEWIYTLPLINVGLHLLVIVVGLLWD
jgi:hypothetical protein